LRLATHVPTANLRLIITVAGQLSLASQVPAQTIHTPHDHIPHFAASPSIRSAADGAWSSVSTWTPARVPGPGDIVSIAHTVTLRLLFRDARDPRDRSGPAVLGCHDGAAQQHVHPWPGRSLRSIDMHHNMSRGNTQPNDTYAIFVYDDQQQPGHDFRACFGVQATQNLYGGLAPCQDTTARPEVAGITCPMAGAPPPPPFPEPQVPPPPPNLRVLN
jgi:hypothetical protein